MAVDEQDNVFCFTRGEHPGHRVRPRRQASCARGARAWSAAPTASPSTPTTWCGSPTISTTPSASSRRTASCLLTIGDPDTPADAAGRQAVQPARPTWRSARRAAISSSPTATATRACTSTRRTARTSCPGASRAPIPASSTCPTTSSPTATGSSTWPTARTIACRSSTARASYQGQWNNLHRPCGLFVDRANGGPSSWASSAPACRSTTKTPNLGPRVTRARRQGPAGGALRRASSRARSRASSSRPTALVVDSRGDVYVGEVSYTGYGQFLEAAAGDPLLPEVQARSTSSALAASERSDRWPARRPRRVSQSSSVASRSRYLPESRTARPAPEQRALDRACRLT